MRGNHISYIITWYQEQIFSRINAMNENTLTYLEYLCGSNAPLWLHRQRFTQVPDQEDTGCTWGVRKHNLASKIMKFIHSIEDFCSSKTPLWLHRQRFTHVSDQENIVAALEGNVRKHYLMTKIVKFIHSLYIYASLSIT